MLDLALEWGFPTRNSSKNKALYGIISNHNKW